MHSGTEIKAVACFLLARQYTIPFPVLSETSRARTPQNGELSRRLNPYTEIRAKTFS